jgi:hypothetical protein
MSKYLIAAGVIGVVSIASYFYNKKQKQATLKPSWYFREVDGKIQFVHLLPNLSQSVNSDLNTVGTHVNGMSIYFEGNKFNMTFTLGPEFTDDKCNMENVEEDYLIVISNDHIKLPHGWNEIKEVNLNKLGSYPEKSCFRFDQTASLQIANYYLSQGKSIRVISV